MRRWVVGERILQSSPTRCRQPVLAVQMCLYRQPKATTDRRAGKKSAANRSDAPLPEETEKGFCRYSSRADDAIRSYKEIRHRPSAGTRSAGSQPANGRAADGPGNTQEAGTSGHTAPLPQTPRATQPGEAGGNRWQPGQPKRRPGTSPHTQQRFPALTREQPPK